MLRPDWSRCSETIEKKSRNSIRVKFFNLTAQDESGIVRLLVAELTYGCGNDDDDDDGGGGGGDGGGGGGGGGDGGDGYGGGDGDGGSGDVVVVVVVL